MFGRKQSSFTLESRLAAYEADMAHLDPVAPVQGAAEAAVSELTPPPERRATPRPDPASYFPPEGEAAATPVDGSLLKLGDAQSLGEAAPVPAPKRRAGRAKTRLLGIDHTGPAVEDVLAKQEPQEASAPVTYHAVGWLVVMDGPGRGHSMPLRNGVSQLGRGDDQSIQLNFGDNSISRSNHASIAFDEEQRCFFIGHGGKANLVRLNDAPVLSTEALTHGDMIRIGETTLQLVAFCGEAFTWADETATEASEDAETATVEIKAAGEMPEVIADSAAEGASEASAKPVEGDA